jgi:hypothetical protein
MTADDKPLPAPAPLAPDAVNDQREPPPGGAEGRIPSVPAAPGRQKRTGASAENPLPRGSRTHAAVQRGKRRTPFVLAIGGIGLAAARTRS